MWRWWWKLLKRQKRQVVAEACSGAGEPVVKPSALPSTQAQCCQPSTTQSSEHRRSVIMVEIWEQAVVDGRGAQASSLSKQVSSRSLPPPSFLGTHLPGLQQPNHVIQWFLRPFGPRQTEASPSACHCPARTYSAAQGDGTWGQWEGAIQPPQKVSHNDRYCILPDSPG